MKKIILLVILCVFASFATVSAEKQEWFDKNYDFSKVKNVYIWGVTINPKLKNGIVENEIPEVFSDKFKLEKAHIMTCEELRLKHLKATGVDLYKVLQEGNKSKFDLEFCKAIYNQTDIYIQPFVARYDVGSEYEEARTTYIPTTETSYVTNNMGGVVGTIQTPTTNAYTTPGGYVRAVYVSSKIDVFDTKQVKKVATLIDYRVKTPSRLANTQPKDMLSRIVGEFGEKIDEKIGDK